MIMPIRYDPTVVTLSVLVAIFASYVALNLAYTVTQSRGRAQLFWLGGGAAAMGIGIWSMHFVGMLAFEMPGMEMAYDLPLMVLSILVAVAASALSLFIVSRPVVLMSSLIAGGIAMAAAIAGMHYIGMYSMRMAAKIVWNPYLVVLSIAIALVASFAALLISIRLRAEVDRYWRLLIASIIMGFAIAGMHYTGMLAATFIHDMSVSIDRENLLVTSGLTMTVVVSTLSILVLALAGSVGQRVWALRKKESDETLEKSETRFRKLVEAVKDYAIFMLDPHGRITTWNLGAERITGYSASEVIGKHVSIFYRAEDLAGFHSPMEATEAELRAALQNGHLEAEAVRVRRDGTHFWANIVITPLLDQDQKLVGFSKVTRDITERRESERRLRKLNEELESRVQDRTKELQKREAQLAMITNALPVLVGQVDRNERFLFVNDALASWFQRTNKEMIGASIRDVLRDSYAANAPYIRRVLAGEQVSYERHSTSGNNGAFLNVTYLPEIANGEVVGFILVASDVSRYKEIEVLLKEAKDAAEVASSTKSAFLANMSHEIRTPLGAVLGFSDLIVNQEMTDPERANCVEVIKRNGRLLSNIINDILDLSKVEAGKLEVERIDIPISEILLELTSLLSLEAIEKSIKLRIVTDGPLPTTVHSDPLRLRQILLNIIGNAIKFTARGSVTVTVNVEEPSGLLAFKIVDTGEGIPSEQAAKLFAPFTQADVSTTRRFGGTGLGLVLSKKLANALGGDVQLRESQVGTGSTFLVTVDPGTSDKVEILEAPVPSIETQTKQENKINLEHLKILVVDDSPDNQALIKKILKTTGASVETANNGREGFERAKDGFFDLVLMDLQMPEMDGYEATRELRKIGYAKPIIALTAHAMKEERKKCLENGFDRHLTKPIDRQHLLEALSTF